MTQNYITETDPKVLAKDVELISRWMKSDINNLNFDLTHEPIYKFIEQINQMHNTYPDFPKEKARTDKIVKLLKNGAPALPIYVEKNDPQRFIMEGRHRIVAFYLLGMTKIPVSYVSLKSQPILKNKPQ